MELGDIAEVGFMHISVRMKSELLTTRYLSIGTQNICAMLEKLNILI